MSLLPEIKNGSLVKEKPKKIKKKKVRLPKAVREQLHGGKKRKKQFIPPKYEAHIQGKRWRDFKIAYWKRHPKKCAACGSGRRMCLHHVHYGYLGREKDEHIVPLCWNCHEEFHNSYGTATVMVDETNEFIEAIQFRSVAKNL